MSGKSPTAEIEKILEDIYADDLRRRRPAGTGRRPPDDDTGWDAMSEDEKQFEAQKRELLVREKNVTIQKQEEELAQLREIHALRTRYVGISFLFVAVFSMAAVAIVVQSGMENLTLDSSVLIALLTTTMANVIGVLCIAFNWLFPKK